MLKEISPTVTHGSFIAFEFIATSQSGKTSIWLVVTQDSSRFVLGRIKWMAPWRKYVFHCKADTIYEKTCLREIAEFCETKTNER
jgi:hypothetical protein